MRTNAKPKAVHSPLPWKSEILPTDSIGIFSESSPCRVMKIEWVNGLDDMDHANAALIVQAVNSHAALVAALKECRKELGYMGSEFDSLVKEADDALKLAGEEI